MYDAGADVIFHAAGGSGIGIFDAAAAMSRPDRELWSIGVDSDQFETVRTLTGAVDPDAWRSHILTSVVLHQDLAVYALLKEFAKGEFRSGVRTFDLASEGVGLSYSGGFIDDLAAPGSAWASARLRHDRRSVRSRASRAVGRGHGLTRPHAGPGGVGGVEGG